MGGDFNNVLSMNYKYISIPSDNSFDRSTPIYGVKVDFDGAGGAFSEDYFAYNFDLTAPASSSNFYQRDDEDGNFVIKVWSQYVKNNNNSAEVKDNNDVCTFFEGDTSVSSVFNSVGTNIYEISFCQPLYLRNIGYFNSTVDESRARGRIELLVEDPSTINATPSKTVLANAGETINIAVECENAWTVTGNTWLTLSAASGTGNTTITATAPSYTGTTARTDTLTFTDSVSGNEAEITISQKKYTSGQPVYLGGFEITELYLDGNQINEAYLGDVLVYSSGPFVGLKAIPSSFTFYSESLAKTLKVKASESWTMTVPAWISASTLAGDAGETIVTLTATAQQADTTGTIAITSANYNASAAVNYSVGIPTLTVSGPLNILTDIKPTGLYTRYDNHIKVEMCALWEGALASKAYLFNQESGGSPFFSCERFRYSNAPYVNIANSGAGSGPANGGGLEHRWLMDINNNVVTTYIDGSQTEVLNISGTWPDADKRLVFWPTGEATNFNGKFYWVKFYDGSDNLIANIIPAPAGLMDTVSNTTWTPTGSGTFTYSVTPISA